MRLQGSQEKLSKDEKVSPLKKTLKTVGTGTKHEGLKKVSYIKIINILTDRKVKLGSHDESRKRPIRQA